VIASMLPQKELLRVNSYLKLTLSVILFFQAGCTSFGIEGVDSDQVAVVFKNLPSFIGGGVSSSLVRPGERRLLWPWEYLIKIKTGIREISFGDDGIVKEPLKTRTKDGNELLLKVVVRYEVKLEAKSLATLVQQVAASDEGIQDLVVPITQSYVRNYMNDLYTKDFTEASEIERVEVALEEAMNSEMRPYGIQIVLFKLRDFSFQKEYQDILDKIQQAREDTNKEKQRIATVRAEKEREKNIAQEQVNRWIQQAEGDLNQAAVRGKEAFLRSKNDAEAIKAQGKAEIDGMTARLKALEGRGGEALLKLEIAKALSSSGSKFVIMNSDSNSLDVNRLDTNQLLNQMGLFESLQTLPKNVKDRNVAISTE
jgi:hypothetical protein